MRPSPWRELVQRWRRWHPLALARYRTAAAPLLLASLLALLTGVTPGVAQSGGAMPLDTTALREAAERGSVEAQSLLSRVLWAEGDQTRSLDWLRRAAAGGDAPSSYGLATLYEVGIARLLVPDTTVALQWYHEAATRGHTGAQLLLAERYESGTGGVRKDSASAFQWYLRAAAHQDEDAEAAHAMNSLAMGSRAMSSSAKSGSVMTSRTMSGSAKSGSAMTSRATALARTRVGQAYLYGTGTQQDHEAARHWLQLAETAEAYRELGKIYLHGIGVQKDLEAARHWFEKAATAGDEVAQRTLHGFPPEPKLD